MKKRESIEVLALRAAHKSLARPKSLAKLKGEPSDGTHLHSAERLRLTAFPLERWIERNCTGSASRSLQYAEWHSDDCGVRVDPGDRIAR